MGTELGIDIKAKGTVVWENDVSNLQNMPVAASSNLPGAATLDGKYQSLVLGSLTDTKDILYDISASLKAVLSQFSALTGINPSNGNNPPMPVRNPNNSFFGNLPNYRNAGFDKTMAVMGTGLAMYEGYNTYQRSLLEGDFLGARTSAIRTTANGVDSVGSALMTLGLIPGLGLPFAITGGVLKAGGLLGKAVASDIETDYTSARITGDSGDSYSALLKAYGNGENNEWRTNAADAISMYSEIVANNKGFGISDSDYVSQIAKMRGYNMTKEQANTAAAIAGNIATSTNADFNSLANLEGLITRYGGNGTDVLSKVYNNAERMGFNDMQFNELIQGIESAMEDGISKGFMASTDDIMNMAVGFTTASGNNSFWSGEGGIQRIKEIQSGMAGATGLNSTSDMLMYQAVSSLSPAQQKAILQDNYIEGSNMNSQMILQMGKLTPEIYNNLIGNVKTAYGDDNDSAIMALAPFFNGRYNIAAQALRMGTITNSSDLDKLTRESGVESAETFLIDSKNTAERQSTTNTGNLDILENAYSVLEKQSNDLHEAVEMLKKWEEEGWVIGM